MVRRNGHGNIEGYFVRRSFLPFVYQARPFDLVPGHTFPTWCWVIPDEGARMYIDCETVIQRDDAVARDQAERLFRLARLDVKRELEILMERVYATADTGPRPAVVFMYTSTASRNVGVDRFKVSYHVVYHVYHRQAGREIIREKQEMKAVVKLVEGRYKGIVDPVPYSHGIQLLRALYSGTPKAMTDPAAVLRPILPVQHLRLVLWCMQQAQWPLDACQAVITWMLMFLVEAHCPLAFDPSCVMCLTVDTVVGHHALDIPVAARRRRNQELERSVPSDHTSMSLVTKIMERVHAAIPEQQSWPPWTPVPQPTLLGRPDVFAVAPLLEFRRASAHVDILRTIPERCTVEALADYDIYVRFLWAAALLNDHRSLEQWARLDQGRAGRTRNDWPYTCKRTAERVRAGKKCSGLEELVALLEERYGIVVPLHMNHPFHCSEHARLYATPGPDEVYTVTYYCSHCHELRSLGDVSAVSAFDNVHLVAEPHVSQFIFDTKRMVTKAVYDIVTGKFERTSALLGVKSGCGTGKTEACIRHINSLLCSEHEPAVVVVILLSIALSDQWASRFPIDVVSVVNSRSTHDRHWMMSGSKTPPRPVIITTLESSHKVFRALLERAGQYEFHLVLDEGAKVMQHFNSPTVSRLPQTLVQFQEFLQRTQACIVIDADLSIATMETLGTMAPNHESLLVVNTAPRQTHRCRRAWLTSCYDTFLGSILRAIRRLQGRRVIFVFCTTVRAVTEIKDQLPTTVSVTVYTADQRPGPGFAHTWAMFSEGEEVKVYVCSPVINAGVSLMVPDDLSVYQFVHVGDRKCKVAVQQSQRIRCQDDILFYHPPLQHEAHVGSVAYEHTLAPTIWKALHDNRTATTAGLDPSLLYIMVESVVANKWEQYYPTYWRLWALLMREGMIASELPDNVTLQQEVHMDEDDRLQRIVDRLAAENSDCWPSLLSGIPDPGRQQAVRTHKELQAILDPTAAFFRYCVDELSFAGEDMMDRYYGYTRLKAMRKLVLQVLDAARLNCCTADPDHGTVVVLVGTDGWRETWERVHAVKTEATGPEGLLRGGILRASIDVAQYTVCSKLQLQWGVFVRGLVKLPGPGEVNIRRGHSQLGKVIRDAGRMCGLYLQRRPRATYTCCYWERARLRVLNWLFFNRHVSYTADEVHDGVAVSSRHRKEVLEHPGFLTQEHVLSMIP